MSGVEVTTTIKSHTKPVILHIYSSTVIYNEARKNPKFLVFVGWFLFGENIFKLSVEVSLLLNIPKFWLKQTFFKVGLKFHLKLQMKFLLFNNLEKTKLQCWNLHAGFLLTII